MYGKIVIKSKLQVLTGMHIGGSSAFSAIGAVDSPVIRDTLTGEPMIPGSSLKGKMRTLLVKALKNNFIIEEWDKDPQEIKRLFGTAGNKNERPKTARLQFADAFLVNGKDLKMGSGLTEVKFENNINRLTAVAMPRQIERAVRGAEFAISLVYDLEEESEIKADFINIAKGLKLISMDYLGGHGTRGYGKVAFNDFKVSLEDGKCPIDITVLEELLKEVEEYGIFSLQA